jgi:hypothetical protein
VQSDGIPAPGISEFSTPNDPLEVTHTVVNFDGDHSLDVTTAVEQNISGYAHYSVQLRSDSGAVQVFEVAAPPGGLQVEMRDMTGDAIPNDLLLRSALLHRLPTVLVNDGHDHFTVAISAGDPGSISCGEQFAPGGNDGHGTIGMMSSGFRTGGLRHGHALFPQLSVGDSVHRSSSGRAPPVFATFI